MVMFPVNPPPFLVCIYKVSHEINPLGILTNKSGQRGSSENFSQYSDALNRKIE